MANAPNNNIQSARNMRRIGVYLAEAADTEPTQDDFRDDVICSRVDHFAGSKLSRADFIVDLGKSQKNIENREVISAASRLIEVWTLREDVDDEDEPLRDQCLFWGELTGDRIKIGDGQQEQWTAIIHPRKHFGEPVEGQLVYNPQSYDQQVSEVVHLDIEFNPEIDGQPLDNSWGSAATSNPEDYSIWIDPESIRTTEGVEYYGSDSATPWTLKEIVNTFMKWKNADEEFIDNPDDDHIEAKLESAPLVRNLLMTSGGNIPEYFDAILQPLGYNWFVKTKKDSWQGWDSKRIVQYYKRGEGTEKEVKLQAYNKTIDPKKDEVDSVGVQYDFSSVVNRLRVQGAFIEREFTLPLYPSWSEDEDGDESDDLKNYIGRKWVANEGGNYTDLRPDIGDPPELSGFGPPKNRVIQDCLTYRDNQRMPVQVDYRKGDSGPFENLRTLTKDYRLLTTEVGIYITAEDIPSELLDLDDIELRITGTINSDRRIEFRTEVSEDAPVSGNVERIERAHSQFFDRQRQTDGDYASVMTGDHDERDDTEEIEEYAEELLAEETLANVSSEIRLFGLNHEYEIGDVLTKIDGRSISFNRSSNDGEGRYVQVVGLSHHLTPKQYTTIHTAQYDI
jgi:hypothetical protein